MSEDGKPELDQLSQFLESFNREADRGAALVAAALLDDRLLDILMGFLVEGSRANELLKGFNAPLGTFSARASATFSLGLIDSTEYHEITLIRKIRNEFGHSWEQVSFDSPKVSVLASQLPYRGPAEFSQVASARNRFNFAVAFLAVDLVWRTRLVKKERRKSVVWPNQTRNSEE